MAAVNGTNGNDFIHTSSDGLMPPAGYTDNAGATDFNDTISSGLGGDDIIHAGGGSDTINFFEDLTGADQIDGGSDDDTVVVNGQNSVVFAANSLTSIEKIQLPYISLPEGVQAFRA